MEGFNTKTIYLNKILKNMIYYYILIGRSLSGQLVVIISDVSALIAWR